MYRNRTRGSTEAKITRAGNRAAKSAAHRGPVRCLIKLTVDGRAPRPAARVQSSGTKLALGTATALATDSTAPSRLAAIQYPQKPARCDSHAPAPPAASRAIAAAAICIGAGCEIQDAPLKGGTLPAATAKASSPAHSDVAKTSMQVMPTPPHMISRAATAPLCSKKSASASSRASARSAAGRANSVGHAMSVRAKPSKKTDSPTGGCSVGEFASADRAESALSP